MKLGIDVSKWNGVIDFNQVKKSGIDYVIIRAGYGREKWQKDAFFDINYDKAKQAGLKIGVYWYSYSETIEDAKLEASACLFVLNGRKIDLPVYFDVEEKRQFDKGRNFCDSIIDVFCSAIEEGGYTPGLYMSASPLKSHVSNYIKNKYDIWVAQYNTKCSYSGVYSIWQYSAKGTVPGINGPVDMNYIYKEYNTEPEPEPEPISEAIHLLAEEVIAGKWGNGKNRKEYIYKAVQAEVNKILGA